MSVNNQKLEWICRYHTSDCKWIYCNDGLWHRVRIGGKDFKNCTDEFTQPVLIEGSYLYEGYDTLPICGFYDSTLADTHETAINVVKTFTECSVKNLKFKDGKVSTFIKDAIIILADGTLNLINKHLFTKRATRTNNQHSIEDLYKKIYNKAMRDYVVTIFKQSDKSAACKTKCRLAKYSVPQWAHQEVCGLICPTST